MEVGRLMGTIQVGRGSAYYQDRDGKRVHVSGARPHSRHVKGRDGLTGTVTRRRTKLRTVAKRRARAWAKTRFGSQT